MKFLTLRQIAEMFPGRSKTGTISPGTVNRWVHVGVNGTKLPYVRVGGTIYVSQKNLDWFISSINAGQGGEELAVSAPMAEEVGYEIAKADLIADGLAIN